MTIVQCDSGIDIEVWTYLLYKYTWFIKHAFLLFLLFLNVETV